MQKCPYYNFNSHTLKKKIPHNNYIQHLLNNLNNNITYTQNHKIKTIFINNNTPNLLSNPTIQTLLNNIHTHLPLTTNTKITIKTNPNTIKTNHFINYQHTNINHISINIQNFNKKKLKQLKHIHNPQKTKHTTKLTNNLKLHNFNLNLIHKLPNQSLKKTLNNLHQTIKLNPPHLS